MLHKIRHELGLDRLHGVIRGARFTTAVEQVSGTMLESTRQVFTRLFKECGLLPMPPPASMSSAPRSVGMRALFESSGRAGRTPRAYRVRCLDLERPVHPPVAAPLLPLAGFAKFRQRPQPDRRGQIPDMVGIPCVRPRRTTVS